MKEEMIPFFSVVAELAGSRGVEVAGAKGGALNLNLNGEFAAAVDETGVMNYHPYKEVFDMMDEVLKIQTEIPCDNPEEGMQLNMQGGTYFYNKIGTAFLQDRGQDEKRRKRNI